jgi:hypothetical protein
MHRVLAGFALALTAGGAPSQQFQFMPLQPRAPAALLPTELGVTGYTASGDIDGDGRSDLVASVGGWPRVFLHPASGWVEGQLLPVVHPETQPLRIDLDADGDRDLVFTPPRLAWPLTVTVFERRASAFAPVTLPWPAFTLVHGVALGDVDGDAFVDMIVAVMAGSATPSLVLVRGGAGPQFTPDVTATPALPYGLWPVLLDADADGDLDVLAAHVTGSLHLLANVGGTFVDATATLGPTRSGYTHLLAVDLDGDGYTDGAASHPSAVDVLWGGPGGFTFVPAVAPLTGVRQLYRGDFDGDGAIDLLAERAGGLDALWNTGPRQFTAQGVVGSATAMRGVIDEDGDGCDDVAFSLDGQWIARCKRRARLEDSAFGLGIAPIPATSAPNGAMLAGDVDGDGRTDLVTPGIGELTVDHALGDGAFRRTVSLPLPGNGLSRGDVADMDGDGDLDLVLRSNTAVGVAGNDGTGNFTWSAFSASSSPFDDDLRVADVDGDGDHDVVLADNRGVVLLRNLGALQFAAPFVVAPAALSRYVELADVDGDGDLDVITDHLALSTSAHRILVNDGLGNFAPGPSPTLGFLTRSVRAGDFDGDGDQDLAAAGMQLLVHRNDGSGAFTDTTIVDLPPITVTTSGNIVVADVDGDGDLDLCAVHQGAPGCLLLLNDGSGRFSDRSAQRVQPIQAQSTGTFSIARVRAADIDDDGDVDLTFGGNFGFHRQYANHLRHLRSTALPRLGGVAALDFYSGPGFGAPGLGLLGVDVARLPAPLHVPGIAGNLELDPNRLQLVAAVLTSPVGVSSAFIAVPPDPFLFGLELWFQGAILPGAGVTGFTNAAYELVLR